MSLTIPLPLALSRFKQLPQRSHEVWQGGVVRLPTWIEHPTDPDGELYRATGAVWVSLRTGLIHLALPPEGTSASPEFAFRALLEFGLKFSKGLEGRPARVEVRDAALRDALADGLANTSTLVAVVGELPAVREVLTELEVETGGGERIPGLLEDPAITLDRLRAFAEAAASFYTARVWDQLANEDLIVSAGMGIPAGMRHVSVLGQGGEQFGIAFFDSRRAFERLLDAAEAGRPPTRAYGVTFGPIDELPFADADAWSDYALPVAGPKAYPLAADMHGDGSIERPDARELTCAEALFRALVATTEDELDSGRWQKRVTTFDGPFDLTLTLPFLLEAEAGDASTRVPFAGLTRMADRSSVRLPQSGLFDSLESVDVGEDDAELPDIPAEDSAGRELTPLERAQELAYDGMEVEGRLRIKRARQALALSPDCADAWVILADAASTAELALERYEQGMAAGLRAIGAERFEELAGQFWEQLDTRPYMRARFGFARTLASVHRDAEALPHYRELLRLNPNDNQGVRHPLVVRLLELDLNDEAGALLGEYSGDPEALWPYARVLWQWRTEGDTPRTRGSLDEALSTNPHVIKYLLEPEALPLARASHFALGSKEEAAYVADALAVAYDSTPGLQEWLTQHPRPRRAGSRTSSRSRKRSR
jgi:tetratricopeptide (TPR) repeat protein